MADDWRRRAEKAGASVVPMRLVTELVDGGRVEPTDTEIVPMGDVFAHRQLTYTHPGSENSPACRIVFEVRRGVPACVSVELRAHTDERVIRAMDLTALKLDELRDDAFAYAGVFVRNPDGGYVRRIGPLATRADRKSTERAGSRRKVTPEFLERVAELHTAAPPGARLDAIKGAFNVKERQALRYISMARDKGLIDD